MNINPESDVLIAEEIKASDTTKAGLYLPPSAVERDNVMKARVLAAGPGKVNAHGITIAHGFEIGDIIVFERRRGFPAVYEGEKYIFINASEVFGTVEDIH